MEEKLWYVRTFTKGTYDNLIDNNKITFKHPILWNPLYKNRWFRDCFNKHHHTTQEQYIPHLLINYFPPNKPHNYGDFLEGHRGILQLCPITKLLLLNIPLQYTPMDQQRMALCFYKIFCTEDELLDIIYNKNNTYKTYGDYALYFSSEYLNKLATQIFEQHNEKYSIISSEADYIDYTYFTQENNHTFSLESHTLGNGSTITQSGAPPGGQIFFNTSCANPQKWITYSDEQECRLWLMWKTNFEENPHPELKLDVNIKSLITNETMKVKINPHIYNKI